MKLVLDPEAHAELREACLFYEDSRTGLGEQFLLAIESALAQIRDRPTLWRRFKGRFRRYILQRFPFGVIYTVEGEELYVAAIMHLKRKPGFWLDRARRHRPRNT